jgi:hypothetical protein
MIHGLDFMRAEAGGGSALNLGQRCGFWPFICELCDAEFLFPARSAGYM